MNLEQMTRDERSLLLYLECCCVDYEGLIDVRKMNKEDIEIAKRWNEAGFITFGRVSAKSIFSGSAKKSHCCTLSPEAWNLAHRERIARFERNYKKRTWLSAKEYQSTNNTAEIEQ